MVSLGLRLLSLAPLSLVVVSIKHLPILLFVLLLASLTGACAHQSKLDDTGINKSVTPASAASDIATARGQKVRWGGVIITSTNLKDNTQLEVLAYPLDDKGRPRRDESPLGRFFAVGHGYLETLDYAPGRMVTLTGQVQDVRENKVGEASYKYPVLAIDQARLWSADGRRGSNVMFGIGVGIVR